MKSIAQRLTFPLLILLVGGTLGFVPVFLLLPPPLADEMAMVKFYLLDYVFILSGPLSGFLPLSPYDTRTPIVLVIFGVVSFIAWVLLLLKHEYSKVLLAIPIVTWCLVGLYGTFLGLAAGV